MKKQRPVSLVRGLRTNQTQAEWLLWTKLRGRQLNGVKFRRQEPLGDYILHFRSFDRKLVIEVDGGQHNESSVIKKDNQRTKWLERRGFQVMRFWNNDVLENVEGVYFKIMEFV